jgi:hypothetical protein
VSLALPLFAINAQAGPIVNGDFELPVAGDGTNGWTASGSGVFWDSINGNPGASFVLNESGEIDTDPMLSQVLTELTIGAAYRIEGERLSYAPSFGDPLALAFVVFLDGVPVLELPRGDSELGWETFSIEFFASATEQTLTFVAEYEGDDSSYRLDNITLNAVPEPTILVLLGSALLMAASRRARG